MTKGQRHEFNLLRRTNDNGVVSFGLYDNMDEGQIDALERLLVRRWLILVDISKVEHAPGLFRRFVLSKQAKEWMTDNAQS